MDAFMKSCTFSFLLMFVAGNLSAQTPAPPAQWYADISGGSASSFMGNLALDDSYRWEGNLEHRIWRKVAVGLGFMSAHYTGLHSRRIYATVTDRSSAGGVIRLRFGYVSVLRDNSDNTAGPLLGLHSALVFLRFGRVGIQINSDADLLFLKNGVQGETGANVGFVLRI